MEIIELKISKSKIDDIFREIVIERVRQNVKFGEQNHPLIGENIRNDADIENTYGIVIEENARFLCEDATNNGKLTWANIIIEELSEALCAKTKEEQRKELIETAACCIAAIESLDRNGK